MKKDTWLQDAINFWSAKINETDLGVDWADAREYCWRCGTKCRHQKCHIIPKSLGGADSVENIIPLCYRCHDEMPNVIDSLEVWKWIQKDHGVMYGTYWFLRAIKELDIDLQQFDIDKYKLLLKNNVAAHFGQSSGGCYFSTASLQWAMVKASGGGGLAKH